MFINEEKMGQRKTRMKWRRGQDEQDKTHQLAVNLQISKAQKRLYIRVLKRHKPKSFTSSSLSVQHDCRVDDFAKLRKEFAHGLGGDRPRETADEQFCCSLVFLTGYGTFGIDLGKSTVSNVLRPGEEATYNLSIEIVLLDHNSVDARWVLKRQKGKTPWPTGLVAHDGACIYLAKLRKVVPQTLYKWEILLVLHEWAVKSQMYVPSVVSQLRPPMNILLYIREKPEQHTWKADCRDAVERAQFADMVKESAKNLLLVRVC